MSRRGAASRLHECSSIRDRVARLAASRTRHCAAARPEPGGGHDAAIDAVYAVPYHGASGRWRVRPRRTAARLPRLRDAHATLDKASRGNSRGRATSLQLSDELGELRELAQAQVMRARRARRGPRQQHRRAAARRGLHVPAALLRE